MMQKEVGERFLAHENDKEYNALSVITQYRCAGENRIRTGVFIRDRSADHNENGTGSVPIEMENGGWDSCMTS